MKTSHTISDKLRHIARLNMSVLPPPIHEMPQLSEACGRSLFCKRDDLTGFAFGGNKIRKLDFLIREALDQGADSIVTFGAIQSNWCRMASVAGMVNGLEVYLVLSGKRPGRMTGNLVLDQIAGAHIEYLDTSDEDLIKEQARRRCTRLEQAGHHPYCVEVGGSTALGSMGYVMAFMEIMEYGEQSGTTFDHILVAAGSAGTQAGLVVGQMIGQWPGRVIGITVSRSAPDQERKVAALVREICNRLDMDVADADISSRVICDDAYLGGGYRMNTRGCQEAIQYFARREGIFLDEVYTGKAAAGLIDYCRTGKIDPAHRTLFVHTGGSVQLFE